VQSAEIGRANPKKGLEMKALLVSGAVAAQLVTAITVEPASAAADLMANDASLDVSLPPLIG